jgi:hypothetical protein
MVACEKFSQFFIEKIDKIREQFSDAPASSVSSIQPVPAEMSFCKFLPVSEDETRKVINASPCKSSMLDPWSTFLVRQCLDILITLITSLINMCFSEGVFPDQFKTAVVTLLIKNPAWTKRT